MLLLLSFVVEESYTKVVLGKVTVVCVSSPLSDVLDIFVVVIQPAAAVTKSGNKCSSRGCDKRAPGAVSQAKILALSSWTSCSCCSSKEQLPVVVVSLLEFVVVFVDCSGGNGCMRRVSLSQSLNWALPCRLSSVGLKYSFRL